MSQIESERLQNRVLFKAYKTTQMLMGPGLLPAMAAVILVMFLPHQSKADMTSTSTTATATC